MGFGSSFKKAVKKASSQVSNTVQKAGSQVAQAGVNAVVKPLEYQGQIVAGSVGALAQTGASVVNSAGQIIQAVQANPGVAGIAGAAFGLPGLGAGFFGGGGGGAPPVIAAESPAMPQRNLTPWIIGGVAVVSVTLLVIAMRKK